MPAQDLSNQIRHWEGYTAELRKHGLEAGRCLSPSCAEWFSGSAGNVLNFFSYLCFEDVLWGSVPGLPTGWSCPRPGTVHAEALLQNQVPGQQPSHVIEFHQLFC